MRMRDIWQVIKTAAYDWMNDRAPQLGAALAFYTVFSFAPLLVIAVAISGFVFGEADARRRATTEIRDVVGPEVATAAEDMLAHTARRSEQGKWATILGIVALVLGSSAVFGQLKEAMNIIWEVQHKPGQSVRSLFRDYARSFAMVACIGFLLLVSLVFSAAVSAASEKLAQWVSIPTGTLVLVDWTVALVIVTLLFAVLFKALPDAMIAWRHVWGGAIITALLFTAGKTLIGLYLGNAVVASSYGAAGSLAVLMLWTYYSSQIVLFGAELTQAYARWSGAEIVPKRFAERVECAIKDVASARG